VPVLPAEQPGGIDEQDQMAQQAGRVENLHPIQTPGHLGAHVGQAFGSELAEEIVQGVVDRPGVVVGAGQEIEIIEDLR